MDGETAYSLGRAFARVLADLRGKPTGRAADRPRARHAPAGAGDGGPAARRARRRGRDVLDAGMVGTEMLYFLVGSRELDGGAMVTASHNPKAYTGREARPRGRAGALRRRRDRRVRDADRGRPAATPPGGGAVEDVDVYADFREHALAFDRPGRGRAAEGRRRRRQRHGGADGRPAARAARPRPGRPPTGSPTASSPTTSPTRCCPENRQFIDRPGARRGRRPRDRLGRRRRPLLLHRRHRRVRRRRLPHRPARPARARARSPGATILYDVRASRAVPDTVAARGRHRRT